MTRKQRLRVCGNLAQLVQTAPSVRLQKAYQQQLDAAKARLK